jgi:hypothetical protein
VLDVAGFEWRPNAIKRINKTHLTARFSVIDPHRMMQTCALTDGFVRTGIIALTYGQVSVNATRCHTVRLEGLYGVSRLLAPITDSTKSFRSMPKRPICMRAAISGNGSSMTLPTPAQGP